MFDLILPLLAINEVRDEPVLPGSCISAYADRRAEQAVTDFSHDVQPLLNQCDFEWVGEVMIRSNGPIPMRVAVRAWLDSPTHRDVILKPRAERIGIGRAEHEGTYVIVVNFGDR